MAFARRQSAIRATIASALLLIAVQAFAHGHIHVGMDEPWLLDCTQCAIAKVPLALAVDATPVVAPPILTNALRPLHAAAPVTLRDRFQHRPRGPPAT